MATRISHCQAIYNKHCPEYCFIAWYMIIWLYGWPATVWLLYNIALPAHITKHYQLLYDYMNDHSFSTLLSVAKNHHEPILVLGFHLVTVYCWFMLLINPYYQPLWTSAMTPCLFFTSKLTNNERKCNNQMDLLLELLLLITYNLG